MSRAQAPLLRQQAAASWPAEALSAGASGGGLITMMAESDLAPLGRSGTYDDDPFGPDIW